PEDDRGVVAVAPELRAQVLLVPVVEEEVVVVLLLRAPPGVERLVHDDEAHAVAEFEQFGRGRVVARAYGVDAHLLEDFELALKRATVQRRAQSAEVVVVADAVQADVLAVEEKARVHVELNRADAE